MRFLKYIRQWGKKVVFLVNKVDILSDSGEARHSPHTPWPGYAPVPAL